ncbi:DUF6477 family protein [Donghicola sp. XS_ASV15]|uniref:DUF6477 family protein n=1 Tax=Donghicola sp. XS_ASV15 TaxID=3241295 RepID=UPI00351920C7
MTELMAELQNLKRPKLLMSAAKAGGAMYHRDHHLSRILGQIAPDCIQKILRLLLIQEQELETQRKTGNAEYRAARHVEVLIALRSEATRWQAAQQENQVKASGMEAFFSATYAANASLMAGSSAGC